MQSINNLELMDINRTLHTENIHLKMYIFKYTFKPFIYEKEQHTTP